MLSSSLQRPRIDRVIEVPVIALYPLVCSYYSHRDRKQSSGGQDLPTAAGSLPTRHERAVGTRPTDIPVQAACSQKLPWSRTRGATLTTAPSTHVRLLLARRRPGRPGGAPPPRDARPQGQRITGGCHLAPERFRPCDTAMLQDCQRLVRQDRPRKYDRGKGRLRTLGQRRSAGRNDRSASMVTIPPIELVVANDVAQRPRLHGREVRVAAVRRWPLLAAAANHLEHDVQHA